MRSITITARIITVLLAITLISGPTMAVNTATFVDVPIPAGTAINNPNSSPGSGTLDGFFSHDLVLHTDIDWGNAAMLVTLTSGSIFQEGEGFGANGKTIDQPDPAGFGPFPSSEFDTYIFDPHGLAAVLGAAGDVGGDVLEFSTNEIDISWSSTPGDTADIGTFSIARITLSGNARGTVNLAFSLRELSAAIRAEFQIIDGHIIPEPASLALLSLGGLGLLCRRRDRNSGEI